jgi:superfamily I DNA and/or RNA helicase
VGALVGQLTNQYRMHSSIGTLVSKVYYEGRLQHATVASDGSSKPWVLHGYNTPAAIRGRSVVWLDLPWCQVDGDRWAESAEPRYHNDQEIEAVSGFLSALPGRDDEMTVALLSPYTQQVSRLNRAFQNKRLPNGLKPQRRLGVRHFLAGRPDRLAHTVDSFQGNQADIVVISLVRNNKEGPRYGLGFLKEEERMNVLISRAGRLLVLVGSFEFFAHQVSTTSPDVPSELRHLRLMVDRLKQMFADGQAVRIPAAAVAVRGER